MKAQPIRVTPRKGSKRSPAASYPHAVVSGWLGQDGPGTYLWLGYKDQFGNQHFLGVLDGAKLYRLAKAITRRFEQSK